MGRGKTLIVDDEDDMRLRLFLTINEENRGLRVVGEASTGDEALALRRELDIDVVVLDQRMPGLTGLETAEAMLAEEPHPPVVLYCAFADETLADKARQIGVRACGQKGDIPSLISALRDLTGLDIGDAVP